MQQKQHVALLDIEVLNQDGEPASIRPQLDKHLVLYFYPKDDTPGCTTEACGFRDLEKEMQALGAKVIGVSPDSPESHQKFQEKYSLSFPLWSDQKHKLAKAFGAWGEKKFMGQTFEGVLRATFVFSPEGKVIKVWQDVKPEGHSQEVLAFLQEKLGQK